MRNSGNDNSSRGYGNFQIEVMVSAGPSKDPVEYQRNAALRQPGEDVCGLCWLDGYIVFCLADGTSNEPRLAEPGLSARTLAQSLVKHAHATVMDTLQYEGELKLPELSPNLMNAVKRDWQQRINSEWAAVKTDEDKMEFLNRNHFRHCGDDHWRVSWSSTLLVGILYVPERQLQLMNLGDSVAVVSAKGQCQYMLPNRPRCFAAIDHYPETPFLRVELIAMEPDIRTFEAVDAFLCLSDGNTNIPPSILVQTNHTVSALSDILTLLRENTGDDRSIIVGEWKTCGAKEPSWVYSPGMSQHTEGTRRGGTI